MGTQERPAAHAAVKRRIRELLASADARVREAQHRLATCPPGEELTALSEIGAARTALEQADRTLSGTFADGVPTREELHGELRRLFGRLMRG